MSAIEFCQVALKERIAPPSKGSVKERILYAARKTGWGYYRTKDVWYADDRVSISADEIKQIETLSGVIHGRTELRNLHELIAQADALLGSESPHIARAACDAMRAFFRSLAGTGTE